ncbi:nuclear transport factor 2 family protein [Anaerotignum sp.]|uniref:nuclear transport factor 2 family protein n=1 Tax=Anaerotignum sp. TaxID=2039241 RepID=UPI002714BCA5|nr:nuclear transport factor 2 family protein [Anaerotignum sp.]
MENKEKIISLWFDMWLKKQDLGIAEIFSNDAVYIESWGPQYKGVEKIKQWFTEWNTRGNVLVWDIKQYFHKGNQTIVEWYFKNTMNDGKVEAFDGVSIIKWTKYGKICFLQEFGCNINNYDPYQDGLRPQLRDEETMWF